MEEIWKDIKGYEGLYQVSNLGSVKSLDRFDTQGRIIHEKLLKKRFEGKDRNYIHCALNKNGKTTEYKVHRLVAEVFLLDKTNFKSMPYEDRSKINLNDLQVNHKDNNQLNNCVDNLEWCTGLYNYMYSNATKVNQYDKNGNFIKQWDSIREPAFMLNVTHSAIVSCCKGKCKTVRGYVWKYVDETSPD